MEGGGGGAGSGGGGWGLKKTPSNADRQSARVRQGGRENKTGGKGPNWALGKTDEKRKGGYNFDSRQEAKKEGIKEKEAVRKRASLPAKSRERSCNKRRVELGGGIGFGKTVVQLVRVARRKGGFHNPGGTYTGGVTVSGTKLALGKGGRRLTEWGVRRVARRRTAPATENERKQRGSSKISERARGGGCGQRNANLS